MEPDWSLAECGIASVAGPVLVARLQAAIPGVTTSLADLIEVDTVGGLAELLGSRRKESNARTASARSAETARADGGPHIELEGSEHAAPSPSLMPKTSVLAVGVLGVRCLAVRTCETCGVGISTM